MNIPITPDLIASHQLTPAEYEKIVSLLGGREPTYTELGIFSVMWSEHCSYKSSRVHLKKLPTKSSRVLVGPGENAGIIDIGDNYAIAFKIESHNHPSFIEPFQGAATGVGGILRDIFTMGARPLAVMDAIRFGRLDDPQTGARNQRILEGVVSGIAHYGNCTGVPTIGGETNFDEGYNNNILVNAMCVGLATVSYTHLDVYKGPPWRRPSSPRRRSRNGRTCRWAIRSWRSYCSKPASRRCARARLSAFRTWAPPG